MMMVMVMMMMMVAEYELAKFDTPSRFVPTTNYGN